MYDGEVEDSVIHHQFLQKGATPRGKLTNGQLQLTNPPTYPHIYTLITHIRLASTPSTK